MARDRLQRCARQCLRGRLFHGAVVVADADTGNVFWTEEVFGPVACVSFRNDDEAIALANDTRYGLVATVVTRDAGAARRYRNALRGGLVWINIGN